MKVATPPKQYMSLAEANSACFFHGEKAILDEVPVAAMMWTTVVKYTHRRGGGTK
jgi:hypothetical protein